MSSNPSSTLATHVYYPSARRYVVNTGIGLGLAGLFALFILFPDEEARWLQPAGYLGVLFFLWLAWFSATYTIGRRPSIVLDPEGMRYRVSLRRSVFVPWPECRRIAIQTSSATMRGRTFTSRFISVYVNDPAAVMRALPLVQRGLAYLSVRMGFAPLSISEPIIDAPLEDVLEAIRRYVEASAAPSSTAKPSASETRHRIPRQA